jgi:hypothetical protein
MVDDEAEIGTYDGMIERTKGGASPAPTTSCRGQVCVMALWLRVGMECPVLGLATEPSETCLAIR